MIGCHMGKNAHGSFANSIKVAYMMGANAVQFNFSPPSSSAAGKSFFAAEIAEINSLRKEHDIYVVCHGKYMYNFCRLTEWQSRTLIDELKNVSKIGCDVVIHQGKNVSELKMSREIALATFVSEISKVLESTSALGLSNRILLENSCQQGTECGFTLEELAKIWNMFSLENHKRLGICIDLCHIFVAGTLDVRSKEKVHHFFDEFDRLIGLSNLKLVHFNDSNVAFDGHNDNHHDILAGFIGNPKLGGSSEGFKEVIQQCVALNVPMILETPGGIAYHETIQLMRSWAEGDTEYESIYLTKHAKFISDVSEKLLADVKPKHKCGASATVTTIVPAKPKIIVKLK